MQGTPSKYNSTKDMWLIISNIHLCLNYRSNEYASFIYALFQGSSFPQLYKKKSITQLIMQLTN